MRSQHSVTLYSYLSFPLEGWRLRAFIATGVLLLVACGQAPQPYDVAMNNGRLIDPESRLDAVRSVGIRAGKIAAISQTPLEAANVVDAQRLGAFAPVCAQKDRIKVGADADIVIFDPATVAAQASYEAPFETPSGIHSVWVAGQLSVQHGELVEGAGAGDKLTSSTP